MDGPRVVLYNSNMLRAGHHSTIRSYNLFGETRDLPDVVHCETIPARSALHGWKLEPHRHARLHQILFISSGGGHATLEGQTYVLHPMHWVNVPTGQVHGYAFTPGTEGWVVTLATEILDQVLMPSEGLGQILLEGGVTQSTPQIPALMKDIFVEFGSRHYARAHILRSLSAMLLGHVARALAAKHASSATAVGADLVKRFEALVDAHFTEHWSVVRYADVLKVSATHLSRLTREAYGCPASRVIRDRLIREARRNLLYTNLPISTIAYTLGFEDPAYFSRAFAQATGLSPSDFRDRFHS